MRTAAKIGLAAIILAIVGLTACVTLVLVFAGARLLHPPIDRSQGYTLLFELQAVDPISADLPTQTIEVLKRRLDPAGNFNFQFKAIGPRRIEIWVPRSAKITGTEFVDLVTSNGILDFRIAFTPADLSAEDAKTAAYRLEKIGPLPVSIAGARARWMLIDPDSRDNFKHGFVVGTWGGESFVLCYDDSAHTLTHDRPLPWHLYAGPPQERDHRIELPFTLDPAGATYMGELTLANLRKPMAILFDDKAMSAPNINGHITDSGMLTFGASRPTSEVLKEANHLKQIMDAGALPARLTPVPPFITAPTTRPTP